jgi:hypothetical protein
MSQNAGDYVLTPGGLDNVITMVCRVFCVCAASFADHYKAVFLADEGPLYLWSGTIFTSYVYLSNVAVCSHL